MNARGATSVYLNKGIAKRPQRNKQSTPRDAGIVDLPPGGWTYRHARRLLTAQSFYVMKLAISC